MRVTSNPPPASASEAADLGIAVAPRPEWARQKPRHRLVAIGDSITQGFKSLAIHDTDFSWPAVVAYELGWFDQFRRPKFNGPDECPGLPINLEALIRQLEIAARRKPLAWSWYRTIPRLIQVAHAVTTYWERGKGSESPKNQHFNHNLAIWGWDLRDAMTKDIGWCLDKIGERPPKPKGLWAQIWSFLLRLAVPVPQMAQPRTAVITLSGEGDDRSTTQVSAARSLGNEGSVETGGQPNDASDGIETLFVGLGSNNALGTVIDLSLNWSEDADYQSLDDKWKYNIWRPEHFQAELALLVSEVKTIRARHVIWSSVPHVTIAPLARGVGTKTWMTRYFARYCRAWITDEDFDGNSDPSLTADQARVVDSTIDEYNAVIKSHVEAARRVGLDWYYFDGAGLLDRLAYRRYLENPQSWPPGFRPYLLPEKAITKSPPPDTRFFAADKRGRLQGGIIALDGVHPTTLGYGIIAQEIIKVMELARVPFYDAKGALRPGPVEVDWSRLVSADTLNSAPPYSLQQDLRLMGWANKLFDFGAMVLARPSTSRN